MTLDVIDLFELVLVVLTLKLIVSRWQPPIQESKQAILCIFLGTGLGLLINPTKAGLVYGIIASGVAFYGGDLIHSFTAIKDDIKDLRDGKPIEKKEEKVIKEEEVEIEVGEG